MYKNNITGPIPEDLNLRSLEYLDIGFNQMTGFLPSSWGSRMRSLKHLYIDHNRFQGPILQAEYTRQVLPMLEYLTQ